MHFFNVSPQGHRVQCTIFNEERLSNKSGIMSLTAFNIKPPFQSAVQITVF